MRTGTINAIDLRLGTTCPTVYEELLRSLLESRYVNSSVIDAVLAQYRTDPEGFERCPDGMMTLLMMMGLRASCSEHIAKTFFMSVSPTTVFELSQHQPMYPIQQSAILIMGKESFQCQYCGHKVNNMDRVCPRCGGNPGNPRE